ncbi:hypothetical protein DXG01_005539 [Tephrocybe rancida]|nr:hypothetical protein DXG01_005539 [Tephrocybe rancida]
MNTEWIKNRTAEFERMTFRQSGFLQEMPVDYLQRRIKSHVYLYPEDEDGPAMVHCMLLLIPVEWTSHLNIVDCLDILELQSKASRLGASLVSVWEMMEASPKGADEEREEEQDKDSDSDEHEAHVVGGRVRGTGGSAAKNQPPWPAGKTVNGYAFIRRDDVSSLKAPNGECYICTSPRHFTRDCPHYGKWDSLRNANLVTSELTEEQHQAWDQEYIAMLAESKASSSVYEPGLMGSTNDISKSLDLPVDFDEEDLIKEVYTMDMQAMGAFALHACSIYMDNHNSQ